MKCTDGQSGSSGESIGVIVVCSVICTDYKILSSVESYDIIVVYPVIYFDNKSVSSVESYDVIKLYVQLFVPAIRVLSFVESQCHSCMSSDLYR